MILTSLYLVYKARNYKKKYNTNLMKKKTKKWSQVNIFSYFFDVSAVCNKAWSKKENKKISLKKTLSDVCAFTNVLCAVSVWMTLIKN